MKTILRSGQGALTAPLIALALLLGGAPAALADHDDWERGRSGYDDYDDYDRYGPRSGWNWEFGVSVGNRWDPWGPGPVVASHFPSLRGHGEWRWVRGADQYLWFPYVDRSWKPYFYGHWVNTRFGMTWVSYEPWGDVPHHYGNWVFVDHLGWGWVPGYDYAPACVTWGVVNGSIGWAPLPPPWYRSSRHYDYRYGCNDVRYTGRGHYRYDSGLDFSFWVFVSNDHFYGSAVHKHALDSRRSLSLFKEKKVLPVGRQLDTGYVQKIAPKKFRTEEVERKTVSFGDRRAEFIAPRDQDARIRDGRKDMSKVAIRAPEPERRRSAADTDRRVVESREPAKEPKSVPSRDTVKSKEAAKPEASAKASPAEERQSAKKEPPEKDRGGKSKSKGR